MRTLKANIYFERTITRRKVTRRLEKCEKNLTSVTRRCCCRTQICVTPTASSLRARKLKFWLPEVFGTT
jgi:hypothetical protein